MTKYEDLVFLGSAMNNFHQCDSKFYLLERNKEFLNWYKNACKNGYKCSFSFDQMQSLIDSISSFYVFKYCAVELRNDKMCYKILGDIPNISGNLDFKQLLLRLDHSFHGFILGTNYWCESMSHDTVYKFNGEVLFYEPVAIANIYNNNGENFKVRINAETGLLSVNISRGKYVPDDIKSAEDLLKYYSDYFSGELDFTELRNCVYNHECDLELRRRLLQMVALKLLYSADVTPNLGYKRAKLFIDEFNEYLKDLNLSTDQITDIIKMDYTNTKKTNQNCDKIGCFAHGSKKKTHDKTI